MCVLIRSHDSVGRGPARGDGMPVHREVDGPSCHGPVELFIVFSPVARTVTHPRNKVLPNLCTSVRSK